MPCTGADFCEEISGAADTSFRRFHEGDPPSRRVHSAPDFELPADLSPLTTGHLLLLPKRLYREEAPPLPGALPGKAWRRAPADVRA
ncbi:hypothetical protein [Amycolatopsis magusensis]|uniref:hypothetical protein n=1 Tax=Amycolatopsis magusensis TaxID=882444 RepID=UPI0037A167C6